MPVMLTERCDIHETPVIVDSGIRYDHCVGPYVPHEERYDVGIHHYWA